MFFIMSSTEKVHQQLSFLYGKQLVMTRCGRKSVPLTASSISAQPAVFLCQHNTFQRNTDEARTVRLPSPPQSGHHSTFLVTTDEARNVRSTSPPQNGDSRNTCRITLFARTNVSLSLPARSVYHQHISQRVLPSGY